MSENTIPKTEDIIVSPENFNKLLEHFNNPRKPSQAVKERFKQYKDMKTKLETK